MINLYVQEGRAYLWDSEDWFELRTKHRICGSLTGSISSHPRQNEFLGLPMALMSEEAALLVENGICELYSLPNLTEKPSDENRVAAATMDKILLKEQNEALRKRRIDQLSQKIDVILAGKKKKMMSKGITDIALDKETLLQEEINKLPVLAPAHTLIHLPTEHFLNTGRRKLSVIDLIPNILKENAVKFAIFKDLWNRGLYLTEGMKFGCDYLVYPGDPVKFHAMYMVKCISDSKATFPPATIVAFGRLSVSVKKLAVLASVNPEGQVLYQTLQWHDSVNS